MKSRDPYTLADLLYLMARLRDPDSGCPWDIKQSFASIAPSTIEEAYEVADAIEQGDRGHLKEELGDLLFQVIFYSQLGQEEGAFDFLDIVDTLTEKLIRRHPHVFDPEDLYAPLKERPTAENEAEVKRQWEAIKREEREGKGKFGLLDDVPVGLPAATRALKLQKRAAQVGFDWPNIGSVTAKVREEMAELEEAVEIKAQQSQLEELGDLLFSIVNLARHLKIEPETALRYANQKFIRRFQYIEASFAKQNKEMGPEFADEMERLWEEAKKRETDM